MNIFHKVALRGLQKSRAQTLVTIVGVALSAALMTAVATFAVSLQSYLIQGAALKYGDWHIAVPNGDSFFVSKQETDKRVEKTVTMQNIGYALLEGGQNPDKPYLFLAGWDKESRETLPITLLSGRLPANSGEVLIPAHVAANGGVKFAVGDNLTLTVGRRVSGNQKLSQHDAYGAQDETLIPAGVKQYTVVGICQRLAMEEYTAPGYTLITVKDADAGADMTAYIKLKDPYQVGAYADSLSDSYRYVLNDAILRFMGLSGEKLLTVLLYFVAGILIALVMLGSVFLIYNSFHISLNERTHQFGILMSVGATEKQLRYSVLFEGLCIGAIGIPLGILAGIPSIQLVLSLVEKNFANAMYDNVPLRLVISAPALLAAVIVSVITILISAYIPAKKAAAIPVMECIRQTNEVKAKGRAESKMRKTSKFAKRFYGLEEILAFKNFQRNRRRYRSIILSLTLSVVLLVSASSFGTYLNQIAQNSAQVVEEYDICFDTEEMTDEELLLLYEQLKTAEGVTESSYQALSTYACILHTKELTEPFLEAYGQLIGYDGAAETVEVQLQIQFVKEDEYHKLQKDLGLSFEDYTGQGENMIMAGILPEQFYTQDQPMTFTLYSQTIRATFVEDFPDMLPADNGERKEYALMLIAPYDAKQRFDALGDTIKPVKSGLTFQSENPGRSAAAMRNMIDGAGITADYHLYNLYEILEQNRNISFIIKLFSYVFIAMISMIAVANVFNTISTNIKLRRRELAMLRSVGMTDRDFKQMMRFECVLYGARTMLFGLPLSVICSVLIYMGLTKGGGTISFVFPLGSIAGSTLGVFVVVFITMLYATGKILKENIMDTLRDDMS